VAVNISDYLKPASRISRHSHELAFQVPSTSVDYIKFSFFPRTARDWNLLPSDVIKAPSLTSFRARLQKGGSDQGPRSLDHSAWLITACAPAHLCNALRFSHLLLLTVFIFPQIISLHIGKVFNSLKLTDYLEEEDLLPLTFQRSRY